MKTKFYILFITLIAFVCSSWAQTQFTSGGIIYEDAGSSRAWAVGNSSVSGDITIPATVTDASSNTYDVLGIYDNAFEGDLSITSVTLTHGMYNVENSAFKDCANLKTIYLPASIYVIEDSAFYNSGLESIHIPEEVYTIGKSAFQNCVKLRNVTFNDPNLGNLSLKEAVFAGCVMLTTIHLPEGVWTTDGSVFRNCTGLTTVTIGEPNGVEFGPSSFYGCTNLRNMDMRKIPNYISDSLFYNCSNLNNVNFEQFISSIGEAAFYGCSSLNNLVIPDYAAISTSAFHSCTGLTNISFHPGYSEMFINDSAFYGCTGLTNISIPASITNIGIAAFKNCSNLNGLTIPAAVATIDDNAFDGCGSLTSVTFAEPTDLTALGAGAFSNTALSQVIMQDVTPPTLFPIATLAAQATTLPTTNSIGVPPASLAAYTGDLTWAPYFAYFATPYTITFDVQGGTVVAPVSAIAGTVFSSLPASNTAGNIFLGWYTDPLIANNSTAISTPFTLTQDTVLYAHWKLVPGAPAPTPGTPSNPGTPSTPGTNPTQPGNPVAVIGVYLNETKLSLARGKSFALMAVVEPVTATDRSVIWSSSDSAIVSVSKEGDITAQASGTAVIKAVTNDGGHMAACIVTVTNENVSNDEVDGASLKAYPSPTTGTTTVTGLTAGSTVRLYSPVGALIDSYIAPAMEMTIDLSHLSTGIYYLNVEGKTIKIIKN